MATVDQDRLLRLDPDPDHPISKGYACLKGTRFPAVHHHEDRVVAPLLGRGDARASTSWTTALDALGGRLRELRSTFGPDSIGIYSGNAAGHSLGAVITFTADYDGSDCVVLVGTDPLSSQPSQAQSHPDGVRALVRVAKRGALVVVDPRRSVTAERASVHLAPRPGSDVDLLAYLLREVSRRRRDRDEWLDAADVEAMVGAVAGYDVARASIATGLAPDSLRALADRLTAAQRPLVWSGLGVLLGPEVTLGYWLTLALHVERALRS